MKETQHLCMSCQQNCSRGMSIWLDHSSMACPQQCSYMSCQQHSSRGMSIWLVCSSMACHKKCSCMSCQQHCSRSMSISLSIAVWLVLNNVPICLASNIAAVVWLVLSNGLSVAVWLVLNNAAVYLASNMQPRYVYMACLQQYGLSLTMQLKNGYMACQ